MNHWNYPLDLLLFSRYLILKRDTTALSSLLTSPFGTNAFNLGLLHPLDKAQYFASLSSALQEAQLPSTSLLSSLKFLAPYQLVALIDTSVFRKLADFTDYNACIDHSSYLDLELLSGVTEYEERFKSFLRYVEILSEEDPRKAEGKKLIGRIFDLERFRALQNTSLQVFDVEENIEEEEGGALSL